MMQDLAFCLGVQCVIYFPYLVKMFPMITFTDFQHQTILALQNLFFTLGENVSIEDLYRFSTSDDDS